jgi:glycosyltransferase involved in cell wall biosynthesis
MSAPSADRRGPIYFCFVNPSGFSGQKAATELLDSGLSRRGWICRRLPLPALDRGNSGAASVVRYGTRLLFAWGRACGIVGARDAKLCVNLGMTRASFVRDFFPMALGSFCLGRSRVVASLHGSLFMNWPDRSIDARAFRRLLLMAGTTTVLGERQRQRLLALGIPGDRIEIVVNSCELAPLSSAEVANKLDSSRRRDVVRILYLSSLIDTKGYPEYLEALLGMSALPGPPVEAVLCGRLVPSEFADGPHDLVSAEEKILEKLRLINRSDRVRVRWIRGAVGEEKTELFRSADLFVLPTRYAVEAQPIVLLEAMASACAIVTTAIGEIPTILDGDSAELWDLAGGVTLVSVLQRLVTEPVAADRLARAAYSRFVKQFTLERHLDCWEKILDRSIPPSGNTS